ncbi:MAG: transketolase [Saprospiraceae bacterium]|nr:transketolase [Saprospiraceae bacterium]MBP7699401.1 transketolase [Saprospiraceae bacterium]
MTDYQRLKNIASQIRRDIVRQVFESQSGHPGGSLGCTEIFVALYFDIMHYNPAFNMNGSNEDLFFLSNGHISPVWYSTLAHAGFFEKKELSTFRQINSRLQGHPTVHEGLPGVRVASGSLGQGMSVAIGAALAKKMNGDDRLVFCLTGDGELQEGQIWEAVMFAPFNKVDNLIAIVDWNGQQIDGPNDKVLSLGDLPAKWQSFGWEVIVLEQGNNMQAVVTTLQQAISLLGNGKPVVVLTKTQMGYGVDFMQGTHDWHGKAPNKEQFISAMEQLPETLGDY